MMTLNVDIIQCSIQDQSDNFQCLHLTQIIQCLSTLVGAKCSLFIIFTPLDYVNYDIFYISANI